MLIPSFSLLVVSSLTELAIVRLWTCAPCSARMQKAHDVVLSLVCFFVFFLRASSSSGHDNHAPQHLGLFSFFFPSMQLVPVNETGMPCCHRPTSIARFACPGVIAAAKAGRRIFFFFSVLTGCATASDC